MTKLMFIKLLRDLRTTKSRILMMVAAMSISQIVFGATLYTRGITSREIPRGYLSTNPASATILFEEGINEDLITAISSKANNFPGVIGATPRTQFTLQVRQANQEWGSSPLQIFVASPKDTMQIENFKVEQGVWPPAAGEILIERGALELLKLKVGGVVVLRTPSGEPVSMKISGVVHDQGLAASFQEQKGYGFITTQSLTKLGYPDALDELKIQVANQSGQTIPSHNRETIVDTSRNLAAWLQQTYPVQIREIQVPRPYAHPHQWQLDMILMALLVFGIAGMLLSAILVATILNGLFAQQIPQIGIMKAIGARSGRIFQLYLLMTMLFAVTATALAFIPAIMISRLWAPFILTEMLAMDAASLIAPTWMYFVVVITGIGMPLLLALIPLVKASRTTVRASLDSRGVDTQGSINVRFDAALGMLRFFDRTVLMAFQNIFRRKARFLLSVGLLASAGSLFVAGMSTLGSAQAVPEQAKTQRQWDVEIQLANNNQASATLLKEMLMEIPHVARVEPLTIVQSAIAQPGQISVSRTYPDQGHGSMAIYVIPPGGNSMMPLPNLIEGRWPYEGEKGVIVINQPIRSDALPGIQIGDDIQLSIGKQPTTWKIIGICKFSFGGSSAFSAFMTPEGYRKVTGDVLPNILRVVTDRHDEATRISVANAVEKTLTKASIMVRSSTSVSRFEAAGAGHMLPIVMIFLAIAIGMGVVGCIGLASTMSTNVLERTREFGVMHAIGAKPVDVRRIVISEGIFIALVSCIVATIPALILTALMSVGLGNLFLYGALPFWVSLPAIVIWVIAIILGAALATLGPAIRVSRLSGREAFVYLGSGIDKSVDCKKYKTLKVSETFRVLFKESIPLPIPAGAGPAPLGGLNRSFIIF